MQCSASVCWLQARTRSNTLNIAVNCRLISWGATFRCCHMCSLLVIVVHKTCLLSSRLARMSLLSSLCSTNLPFSLKRTVWIKTHVWVQEDFLTWFKNSVWKVNNVMCVERLAKSWTAAHSGHTQCCYAQNEPSSRLEFERRCGTSSCILSSLAMCLSVPAHHFWE